MCSVADVLACRFPQVKSVEKLNDNDLKQLLELIQDWSAAHGLIVADGNKNDILWKGAAVTLVPSCIPANCFKFGAKIAPYFSELFHKISLHPDFLENTLKSVTNADSFTKNLLDIYQTCKNEGFEQTLSLGIYRSDYMIQQSLEDNKIKSKLLQIEVNAIAAAFSHLGHLSTLLHKYIISSFPHLFSDLCNSKFPDNDSHLLVPNALQTAHFAFLKQREGKLEDNYRKVIFLVAQPGERNRIDQRHVEFTLFEKYKVQLIRTSLIDIHKNGYLSENKNLLLNQYGETVMASVVYFRAGYTPDDFPSKSEWDARLLIEQSSAIKAPSIGYHLCGTKRVQQVLGDESIIKQFFPDEPHIVKDLVNSFAGMYDLDRNGKHVNYHNDAIKNPHKYVMKPQREGGGSLVTGENIREAIQNWDDDKLNSHILMERITPIAMPNYLIFGGKLSKITNVVPEIGFFHSFLGDLNSNILLNETKGYLVRTKPFDVDDGGVAAGRAALDSVCLCCLDE